jgi:hypothetical protein
MKSRWRFAVAVAAVLLVVPWSETAFAKGCEEVSDVVGYERCSRFGETWRADRLPPLVMSLELEQLRFDPRGRTFDVGKDQRTVGSFGGNALGASSLQTFGAAVRIDGYVWGPLYLGVRMSFGLGRNDVRDVAPDGGISGGSRSPLVSSFSTDGIVGVRVPLGRVSLRLESLGGGTVVAFGVDQGHASAKAWTIEPRAVVDVWATPIITMSVYGGANLLDPNDRSMGLLLGLHSRSFDGAFALW